MGANFDDTIQVSVTTDAAPLGRAGFGTLLVVDAASMAERVRYYTSTTAITADETAGSITAAQGTALRLALSQRPRPARVAAGRAAAEVAGVTTITVGGTVVTGVHSFRVNGELVSLSATVPTDTTSTIAAGLRAAATTALASLGIVVSGAAAQVILTGPLGLTITISDVTVPGTGTITPVTTTAAVSIATGLDAIVAEQNDWYGLALVSRAKQTILNAAAWTEGNGSKLYVAQSSDADILTSATDDVASLLQDLNYTRTALLYFPTDSVRADAAWLGNRLAADLDVRQTAWYNATLIGVSTSATNISNTAKTNALAKNANLYLTLQGGGATGGGKVASGLYIDEITTIDWVIARAREAIAQLFLNVSNALAKIPYTDEGFAQIGSVVQPVLERGLRANHFALSANGEPPVVILPRLADVDSADRANRLYRFSFAALLSSGIREVVVSGSVTNDNDAFEALIASLEV